MGKLPIASAVCFPHNGPASLMVAVVVVADWVVVGAWVVGGGFVWGGFVCGGLVGCGFVGCGCVGCGLVGWGFVGDGGSAARPTLMVTTSPSCEPCRYRGFWSITSSSY